MTFDPTKEVPSLELCRRLKELGYPQEKYGFWWVKADPVWADEQLVDEWELFYWDENHVRWCYEDLILLGGCDCCAGGISVIEKIKAPTVRELGEMLGCDVGSKKIVGNQWMCFDEAYYRDSEPPQFTAETEANARAKMLIWLVENGYVTFNKAEEVKK